jgi:hypothetical protein
MVRFLGGNGFSALLGGISALLVGSCRGKNRICTVFLGDLERFPARALDGLPPSLRIDPKSSIAMGTTNLEHVDEESKGRGVGRIVLYDATISLGSMPGIGGLKGKLNRVDLRSTLKKSGNHLTL